MVPPRGKNTPDREGDASTDPDTPVPADRGDAAGGDTGGLGPAGYGNGGLGIAQLLRDTQRALSRLLASRIADYGVSIGQWYFLRALWDEDGLTQPVDVHDFGFRVDFDIRIRY